MSEFQGKRILIIHNGGEAQAQRFRKDGMPMWERRHHTFDKNNNKGDWFYKCYSPLRYYVLVVICGVSAAVKYTETGNICPLLHFEIIIFSCLIACGIIFWRCNDYIRLREKYIKQWEAVKEEEA